jgi:hypothetical protein
MKRSRVLMIGLALALSGCNSGRSTALSSTAPQTSVSSATTDTSSVASPDPLAALQEQLRQARKKLEAQYTADPSFSSGCFKPPFILSTPDLTGYTVGAVDAPDMMSLGATVTVRLVDRADGSRWVDMYEQMACNGVLPDAPAGATNVAQWHTVNIPNFTTLSPSQVLSWTQPDGSNELWLFPGCGPTCPLDVLGTAVLFKGHNVDQEAIFRLFNSLQPVSE